MVAFPSMSSSVSLPGDGVVAFPSMSFSDGVVALPSMSFSVCLPGDGVVALPSMSSSVRLPGDGVVAFLLMSFSVSLPGDGVVAFPSMSSSIRLPGDGVVASSELPSTFFFSWCGECHLFVDFRVVVSCWCGEFLNSLLIWDFLDFFWDFPLTRLTLKPNPYFRKWILCASCPCKLRESAPLIASALFDKVLGLGFAVHAGVICFRSGAGCGFLSVKESRKDPHFHARLAPQHIICPIGAPRLCNQLRFLPHNIICPMGKLNVYQIPACCSPCNEQNNGQ